MLNPFATQSKASATTLEFSGERLVNYMLRPGEGVGVANLLGRSGLSRFATVGAQPVQNMVVMGGNLYVASDGSLYKITPAGAVTTVGSTPYYVTRMASNGFEIGLVGGGAYFLSDGSTVAQVQVPALSGGVTDIAFMDQYFILSGSTGARNDALTVSGLSDGATFDPVDVAFAENDPDGIVALARVGADLWVLGSAGYEVFYNAGSLGFPFLPRGVGGSHGCLSVRAMVLSNDVLFWVRQDGALMMADGYSARNVATPEMQEGISKGEVVNVISFTDRSHDVIAVILKDAPAWCFDLTTGLVHERATGADSSDWTARSAVKWGGVDYVGTFAGSVCRLSDITYEDDGEVIPAQATMAPVVQADRFPVSRLHLNIRGGVGLPGRTPKAFLETSRDGHLWSPTKERDLSDIGEYFREARWHGLGSFKRFQARVTITDPVPRDILGAQIG